MHPITSLKPTRQLFKSPISTWHLLIELQWKIDSVSSMLNSSKKLILWIQHSFFLASMDTDSMSSVLSSSRKLNLRIQHSKNWRIQQLLYYSKKIKPASIALHFHLSRAPAETWLHEFDVEFRKLNLWIQHSENQRIQHSFFSSSNIYWLRKFDVEFQQEIEPANSTFKKSKNSTLIFLEIQQILTPWVWCWVSTENWTCKFNIQKIKEFNIHFSWAPADIDSVSLVLNFSRKQNQWNSTFEKSKNGTFIFSNFNRNLTPWIRCWVLVEN